MAPLIYPVTKHDADQVIQYVYDEATQTLRTTATAVIIGQPIEVEIDMATDSIRLGDGVNFFTSTTIGPDVGLDVNLINTVLTVTGTVQVSNFPATVSTNYGLVTNDTLRTAAQIGNATGPADFNAGLTTAQTLRVVLPTDQTPIPVVGTITTDPDVNIHDSAGNNLTSTGTSLDVNITNTSLPVTQSGIWNINNVSGTISLPTGAATSALQTTGNTFLSSIDSKLNSLGQKVSAASVPVVIASDQSPITVTGTITTSPNVNIHDAAGNNLTSQVNGAQRALDVGIDVAGVQIDPRQIRALTAADVVTANAGTGNFTVVQPTGTNLHAVIDSGTIAVTQSTSPWVISGTVTSNQGTSPWVVSGTVAATQSGTWTTGRTWTLASGTDSVSAVQSGTWNINNITGTISLPTGAATEVTLAKLPLAQGSTTSGQFGVLELGAVTTAAPTYTTGQSSPLSLTTAGALRVDTTGSAISGTVLVSNLPTTVDTNYGVVGASTLRSAAQIGNATGAALFGAGTTTAQVLRVVLPTDQTAIPVTQSTSPWVVSGTVAVTQSTSPWVISGTVIANEDKNYGTVGANTLRTASQIGNATGAADFNSGTTSAQTLRVVLPTNQSSIPVTQSGAWTVSSTQGTSPWVVSGTVTANQGTSGLPGNAWYTRITDGTVTVGVDPTTFSLNTNIVNPTNFGALSAAVRTAAIVGNATGAALFGAGTTTAQVLRVVLPTDQTAIPVTQSTSPWVISGTTTAAEDKNYGTVGATTLRTAAQIGNATGAALFGAGTTTAQVLRVVLPTDQTAIPVTQSTSPWVIAGPAASGAAKSGNPVQSGSVFNTTQPTVTTGQVVENQATARGALIVATGVDNFNINNISGTVSLPTGAATEATLAKLTQTQGSTTSGQSGPLIQGAVTTAAPTYTTGQTSPLSLDTSGALRVTGGQVVDKTTFTYGTTSFANIGGVFQDTSPALTAGQSGAVRLTANRAEHVNLRDSSGNELLGQKTMANSVPVVLASDQSALPITLVASSVTTYSAATTGLVSVAASTDIFTITGSGTKTVKIKKIRVTANRTGNTTTDILLIKRSTANTGGTSTTETSVPHDSTNAAATATIRSYTANPTLGTAVGTIRTQKQFINVAATGTTDVINWEFGQDTSQPIVLRGTSQVLAVNLNGQTITVSSFNIYIEYTEE